MIPRPEPDDEPAAPVADLVAGLGRTMWPWLVLAAAVVGAVGFLLWGANRPDDPVLAPPERTPTTPADGIEWAEEHRQVGDDCLLLMIADDDAKRATGLRHREGELQRVDGMLFVAGQPTANPFTMAGVVEPLALGFYDDDGARVGGHEMEPCPEGVDCPAYAPEGTWSFAIETAPGALPDGPLGGSCTPTP